MGASFGLHAALTQFAKKHAMDLNGYYGGPSRLPFLPLTADVKSDIEKMMAGIRS